MTDNGSVCDIKLVVDQLTLQYGIYRDEVRTYIQLVCGSSTLLVIILFGEITAAHDKPELLMLVPLSVISFAALLSAMSTFMGIAASYSELLELKINFVLGRFPLFLFESNYRYLNPIAHKRAALPVVAIWILIPVMPVTLCFYSLWELKALHPHAALVLAVVVIICMAGCAVSGTKAVGNMRQRNAELFAEWIKISLWADNTMSTNTMQHYDQDIS
ncbi:MAG TPA: hypothetical protein VGK24_07270 [Candidatus Angelobacter sp.]|jgi:hypothetical protein